MRYGERIPDEKTARQRDAEIALGARSRHQAEAEVRKVDSERLAATIADFIEWRHLRLLDPADGRGLERLDVGLLYTRALMLVLDAGEAKRHHARREAEEPRAVRQPKGSCGSV